MRPEKARNIISRAIELYRKGSCNAIYHEEVLRAIYKLQSKHAIWNHENDYENSDYIPSQDDDYEGIENEMHYISDRFDAEHRLTWLAFGIEENLF